MDRREVLQALVMGGAMVASRSVPGSAADRKLDLHILSQALALHPGLHRYNSQARLEASLHRLTTRYLAARDLAGAYLALSAFLAGLRCGHTYANFSNQRRAVATSLFDRPTRLPFEFRWIGGLMVVTRCHASTQGLSPGTVVEAVDGVLAANLLQELLPYARADGSNDGKRRALLSVQGREDIESFDVYQGLQRPPHASGWRLRVRAPGSEPREIEMPALTLADRRRTRPLRNRGAPLWTWAVTPDSIAILTMPTWAMYSSEWRDWKPWLAERLASLAGTRALIVDLRENEGGEDCGDEILSRLTTTDLRVEEDRQLLRFRTTPPSLDPHLDTWDEGFRKLGAGARAVEGGFYARPGAEEVTVIRARAPRIPVPVAALIGPVNSSATFQFARRARATGAVRLFGSETGGNRRGINGGCYFFARLPVSGLEFDLPLVGYFPRTPQPDAGIVPDVVVAESLEDVAKGRDQALDAALNWARRG